MDSKRLPLLLLVSVFVVATCGLIYELVAGTLASYLLGDSVTQFSTIIGTYLFAMGIGSYLSKFFNRNLIGWFIQIEILVGLVGGFSSSILFMLFEMVDSFRLILYLLVAITGILVGLEIPLLMRILEGRFEFKDLISKVFTFDYIGALLASIIFPLMLVPFLGLIKTSFLFGLFNVGVALLICIKFKEETGWSRQLQAFAMLSIIALLTGFIFSEKIMSYAESIAYNENIIYSTSTPYQRLVVTKNNRELRLYLNGNLQFSTADEYRYHEALVHTGLQSIQLPQNVLILGGGDGLAAREVLKYPSISSVTLVDLDKEVTKLFSSQSYLLSLNDSSLLSPKVKIINEDAFLWLRNTKEKFDFVIVDFPDPSNYSIGKLYSNTFYKVLHEVLNSEGLVIIQSTSPYVAPKSFWCVNHTLNASGFYTFPFHCYVPSFGDWGYVLASKQNHYQVPEKFISTLKFLNPETARQMFIFPKDMQESATEVNKLNNQVLVQYFEKEWQIYQ